MTPRAAGMTPLARLLAREIADAGPISIARWMALCLGHPDHGYYPTRDPLGTAGDFTTAPEISQMFGEMIGLWLADLWLRAGSPAKVRLVELGPGRGTLMADLLRATRAVPGFAAAAQVHFVETSPVLRAAQAKAVPHASAHAELAEVPDDAPLLLVANEFFDALPIRQFVRVAAGWRERMVSRVGDRFAPVLGSLPAEAFVPGALWNSPVETIVEASPASTAIAAEIGVRLAQSGGAAVIIDYGHAGPVTGDTLQAVRGHASVDPFAAPGEVDLTAHVDFTALGKVSGARAFGPVGQGAWLDALGIAARATSLKGRATPEQAAAITAATQRLTDPAAMGDLFKVLALTAPGWPEPVGFSA